MNRQNHAPKEIKGTKQRGDSAERGMASVYLGVRVCMCAVKHARESAPVSKSDEMREMGSMACHWPSGRWSPEGARIMQSSKA
jgi:hypothetical protein